MNEPLKVNPNQEWACSRCWRTFKGVIPFYLCSREDPDYEDFNHCLCTPCFARGLGLGVLLTLKENNMSVKDAFEYKEGDKPLTLAITPELKAKILDAFIALEEVLKEAFPGSYTVGKVITLIELAAYYVGRLLK